jgi:putative heme-binding domain-containing protein
MANDAIGGQMLIGMAADNSLPKELFSEIGIVIFNNPDLAVRVQASSYFKKPGTVKTFSIKNILALKGDAQKGQTIFNSNCLTCHKVNGQGMDVGPDLSLIKNKFDKEGLLDAIVNPNAGVLLGYEQWLINTKNGETFFGIILSESDKATVIKDLTGKRTTIETSAIVLKKKQTGSIMPEPSSLNLSEQDLADVVGWLVGVR